MNKYRFWLEKTIADTLGYEREDDQWRLITRSAGGLPIEYTDFTKDVEALADFFMEQREEILADIEGLDLVDRIANVGDTIQEVLDYASSEDVDKAEKHAVAAGRDLSAIANDLLRFINSLKQEGNIE